MLRLASDADVHGDIIRGLRRRLPEIEQVVRAALHPIFSQSSIAS